MCTFGLSGCRVKPRRLKKRGEESKKMQKKKTRKKEQGMHEKQSRRRKQRRTTEKKREKNRAGASRDTQAALGPPRFHTTARELQTGTFEGLGFQKHHQNATKGPPREGRKKTKCGGRREKTKFWPLPPFAAPNASEPQPSKSHRTTKTAPGTKPKTILCAFCVVFLPFVSCFYLFLPNFPCFSLCFFVSFSFLGAKSDFLGAQFRGDFSQYYASKNQFLEPSRGVHPFETYVPLFVSCFFLVFLCFS